MLDGRVCVPILTFFLLISLLICPSVYASPTINLSQLRITTGTDSMQIRGSINNPLPTTQSVHVKITVIDSAETVVFQHSLNNPVVVGSQNAAPLAVELTQLPVTAWWPERPVLYTTKVSLATSDAIVFEQEVVTGFRTFTARDGRFYLNGLPYFIRGAQYTPMFSNGANEKLAEQLQDQPDFPSSLMNYFKTAQINMTKAPYQDLADSLGIMNFGNGQGGYAMSPHSNSPLAASALGNLQKQLEQNVDVYYNHPSFVMPVFWNEADTKSAGITAYLAQVRQIMRQIDTSRPVVANLGFGRGENADVDSAHWYYGYHTAGSDLYRVRTVGSLAELRRAGSTDLPFILTETGGNYTDEKGEFSYSRTGQFPIPDMIWIGRSHKVKEDSLEYQAITVKELGEGFRRARSESNRISGVIMFTSYFFFDGEKITPKPAFDALKQVMQPILVSTDSWKWHYYSGDKLQTGVHVVHDDVFNRDVPPGEIRATLVDAAGAVIAGTTVATPPITYYSNWQGTLSLTIPQVENPVRAQLCLEYIADNKVLSRNMESIFIAPKAWVQVEADLNKVPLALYDPSGDTAIRLRDQGVAFTTVDSLDNAQLAGYPGLVVGANTLKAADVSHNRELLLSYADDGGHVLILKQTFNTGLLLPFSVDISSPSGHSFLNADRIEEPLFSGLEQADFRYWADETGNDLMTAGQGFRFRNVADLRNVTVWGTSGTMQKEMIITELQRGLGRILIDNSTAFSKSATDPFAGRFLANELNYLRAASAAGLTVIDSPVEFGNFATERGIIVAEELQGWKVQPNRKGRVLTGGVKLSLDGKTVSAGHLFFQLPAKPQSFTFTFLHATLYNGTAALSVNGTLVKNVSLKFGENNISFDVSGLDIDPKSVQLTLALSRNETTVLRFAPVFRQ